ncbi:hypothetical protein JAAARDRAFT_211492 [Jaapia argillacea MUCL 33604]|uniref:Uncharacterized protein n=1 Tax=Jaapia argillacea MUCL 33604 TaxID=933084 RepID=A0A067P7A8_9AGAM|nr:hypothetical protein JAAARDRAFT_211492 [Jaapia argillacea MUCL 33604]
MGAPPSAVFSAFSFVAFVLVLIPSFWQFEAWNVGVCCYILWTASQILNLFINSIIWDHNTINWAPVWCDISTRIWIGATIGIPTASLCINRRLYHVSRAKGDLGSSHEKRRVIITDLSLCVGIPLLEMVMAFILQGHRFDIFEDVGCFPVVYNTPPAYALVAAWPLAISAISAVYGGLTIIGLARLQKHMSNVFAGNRNLSRRRYIRPMALAGAEILVGIPLSALCISTNVQGGISHWISFSDTHWNFSEVDQIPSIFWKSTYPYSVGIELSRWYPIICASLFFCFFGLGQEAWDHYRGLYAHVIRKWGWGRAKQDNPEPNPPTATANTISAATSDQGGKGLRAPPRILTSEFELDAEEYGAKPPLASSFEHERPSEGSSVFQGSVGQTEATSLSPVPVYRESVPVSPLTSSCQQPSTLELNGIHTLKVDLVKAGYGTLRMHHGVFISDPCSTTT